MKCNSGTEHMQDSDVIVRSSRLSDVITRIGCAASPFATQGNLKQQFAT